MAEAIPRERAQRLFSYLRELALLRSKIVRDVDDYEQVIWLGHLPTSAGESVFDPDHHAESGVWIEFDRVTLPVEPELPTDLLPWVDRFELMKHDADPMELIGLRDDVPDEVIARFSDYVDTTWRPWALLTSGIAEPYRFYADLFAMSERRQRLGEVYELVIGLGLVSWIRNGLRIRRHIITTPAEITVDSGTGRISVLPSASEGRNRAELDMLEPEDHGDPEIVRSLQDEVEGADPLDLAALAPRLLTEWVNRVHHSGRFAPDLRAATPGGMLSVTLAPALILRKRGERTTSELLGAIARRIGEDEGPLPRGVEQLVHIGDSAESTPANVGAVRFEDPEVYFPLPSNREQKLVLDHLQRHTGVLVQGPPGTGKSLTIANLISHLLAQGKRVLVTSQTERALKVLRNKLPDELKPLCIALLGSDRDSVRDLEEAVEEIAFRRSRWSPESDRHELTTTRDELQALREARAVAERRLREIRESAALGIEIGGYRGTSQQIAIQLAAGRDLHGWIRDHLELGTEPPLDDSEFLTLLQLARTVSEASVEAASARLPDPDELLSPAEAESLFGAEAQADADFASARTRFGPLLDELEPLPIDALRMADGALRDFVDEVSYLLQVGGWVESVSFDAIAGRAGSWRVRMAASESLVETAAELLKGVGDVQVAGLGGRPIEEALASANTLLEHAKSGGRLRTGLFAKKEVRENRWLLDGARLDGAAVTSDEDLALLRGSLQLTQALEALDRLWFELLDPKPGQPARMIVARYVEALADLKRALSLEGLRARAHDSVRAAPSVAPADWRDIEQVKRLADAVASMIRIRDRQKAREAILQTRAALAEDRHPTMTSLRSAIDDRDAASYRRAWSDYAKACSLADDQRAFESLSAQLAKAAPQLSESLGSLHLEVDEASLAAAWAWRASDARLAKLVEPGAAQRLSREIGAMTDREKQLLGGMAAQLAWDRMLSDLTGPQAQALGAWTVTVRKIGKGRGKYAERHRQAARQYMGEVRGAIPAWIMPMYRVAESVEALPGAFDVVIVDEASQSGVESLFLFYLAKQVIVVGDDQQIAPEAVGIDQSAVHALQAQYLEDVPFNSLFSPDNSLFDQARVRFPSGIVLREHFRCMPEIIQFSNEIAYRAQSLMPLRQYGADRLEPINTVYLEHGYREGGRSAINRPEADEIVARIAELCTDPRYEGKTMGVISLQGSHQAALVERMLLDRLGPRELLARQIVCGDAYAFQGDERDVIFLSMVAAPNERIGALANEAAKRRFNVAASRARDQVWLVHSVSVDDLSTEDMRRRLLEYYLAPTVAGHRTLADIDPGIVNAPFESRFEQDVYLLVLGRGYRVLPQFQVADYRIDLVVEGMRGRIAVECDGDHWHGPDRWDADMARQRQLERCGWTFFRVGGSEFYRDSEAALEPLWSLLARHGVEPGVNAPTGAVSTRAMPLLPPGSPPIDRDYPSEGTDWRASDETRSRPEPPPRVGPMPDPEPPDETPRLGPRAESDPLPGPATDMGTDQDDIADVPGTAETGQSRVARVPVLLSTGLVPYKPWDPTPMPDPREAERSSLASAMLKVVEIEGPITADRLYRLVIKAGGFARVTRPARSALNRAFFAMRGVERDEFHDPNTSWPQRVVRMRGTPRVMVRELGPRELYEVPLNELSQLFAMATSSRLRRNPEDAKRRVLEVYGFSRLTPKVDAYLDAAIQLLEDA